MRLIDSIKRHYSYNKEIIHKWRMIWANPEGRKEIKDVISTALDFTFGALMITYGGLPGAIGGFGLFVVGVVQIHTFVLETFLSNHESDDDIIGRLMYEKTRDSV